MRSARRKDDLAKRPNPVETGAQLRVAQTLTATQGSTGCASAGMIVFPDSACDSLVLDGMRSHHTTPSCRQAVPQRLLFLPTLVGPATSIEKISHQAVPCDTIVKRLGFVRFYEGQGMAAANVMPDLSDYERVTKMVCPRSRKSWRSY